MHYRDISGAVQEGRAAAFLGSPRKSPYANEYGRAIDGYESLNQAWLSGYDAEINRPK